ncbi:MAG: translation elongation factor Ts [Patescibacteria group bacterium]
MAKISAALVKELRDSTGIAMLKCKAALEEASGDVEAARDILRKQGEADAAKRSERSTGEGVVRLKLSADGKKGVALALLCETDFVARGDDFQKIADKLIQVAAEKGADAAKAEAEALLEEGIQKVGENLQLGEVESLEGGQLASYIHSNDKIGVLVSFKGGSEAVGKDIAMQIAAMNPRVISPEEVPEEEIKKESQIQKELLKQEGKPAEMIDKILEGKLRKFRDEKSLLKQAFVKDSDKTVEQFLQENSAEVEKFVRLAI